MIKEYRSFMFARIYNKLPGIYAKSICSSVREPYVDGTAGTNDDALVTETWPGRSLFFYKFRNLYEVNLTNATSSCDSDEIKRSIY